jgi:uncharacterized protein YdaU (DUF1376 family)
LTAGLALSERGLILELLLAAWTFGAALPADPRRLAQLCRCTVGELAAMWAAVEPSFRELNASLQAERVRLLRRAAQFRAGASATNRRRWGAEARA